MPSPQYLIVNKPGWVHCQVLSDPRAKIFWSKTLQWPRGTKLNKLEFIEFSNGSLYVRKAQLRYEGTYYCTAANSGGFEFKSVQVKVGGMEKQVKLSVRHKTCFICLIYDVDTEHFTVHQCLDQGHKQSPSETYCATQNMFHLLDL